MTLFVVVHCGDIMRKSIVFDKNTPDVFLLSTTQAYWFRENARQGETAFQALPIRGRPVPEDYKSDCYNDVDETEYACKEKYRIMKRFNNPDGNVRVIDAEK